MNCEQEDCFEKATHHIRAFNEEYDYWDYDYYCKDCLLKETKLDE